MTHSRVWVHGSVTPMHGSERSNGPTDGSKTPQVAYKVADAARHLDVSPRMMWRWIAEGRITSFKIGNIRRVSHQALLDFVERESDAA